MFPDFPVFDGIRDGWDDRVTAWDLAKRPVRVRKSDDSMLDPETAIVADCEPSFFRQVVRAQGAEEIAEEMHQRDLERAAQPPVIEVTVTTPPEGMPRAQVTQLAMEAVARFTGPQPVLPADRGITDPFPAVSPDPRNRKRGKVLQATRRFRQRRSRLPDVVPVLPVSEDDQPTVILPAVPDTAVVEVHIP